MLLAEDASGGGEAAAVPVRRVKIAVVIPSYRASATILDVIAGIGPDVWRIYVVDDACPQATADVVTTRMVSPRVQVLRNPVNLGVGGAVKRGYRAALDDGVDIVVKLDADGQMDPSAIGMLIAPIRDGGADYAKGDRLSPTMAEPLRAMPFMRRCANRLLSAVHGVATGYGDIRDPANGFTAISATALRRLDLARVSDCFFFETDMLFALGRAGGRVADVPLPARYAGAGSSLSLWRVAPRFGALLVRRTVQRLGRAARV